MTDKQAKTGTSKASGTLPCYTQRHCNDMAWNLYAPAVVKCLKDEHGVPAVGGWKIVNNYHKMMVSYHNNGHSYRECAFDIHKEWLSTKPEYKRPTVSDHLKSGACLGFHKT